MKLKKPSKVILNKVARVIITILLIVMVVLIYMVAPKITNGIQNLAKIIYELDATYITRVIELVLAVTLVGAVAIVKRGE